MMPNKNLCALVLLASVANCKADQLCFEIKASNYDRSNYYQQWGLVRMQLITTQKIKDSNGYMNYQFMGHAHNIVGDTLPIIGSGYVFEGKAEIGLTGSLLQFTQGQLGPNEAYPAYDIHLTLNLDSELQRGTATWFNVLVNSQVIDPKQPNSIYNDFSSAVATRISCKNYNFN